MNSVAYLAHITNTATNRMFDIHRRATYSDKRERERAREGRERDRVPRKERKDTVSFIYKEFLREKAVLLSHSVLRRKKR